MRVKVRQIGTGLHPSEIVVEVRTKGGVERLVVDKRSLERDSLDVGWPIAQKNGHLLVELPRETMSGLWRVWVKKQDVVPDVPEREAMGVG